MLREFFTERFQNKPRLSACIAQSHRQRDIFALFIWAVQHKSSAEALSISALNGSP
jgi:hypothetical protein